jgi:hypothetical protein
MKRHHLKQSAKLFIFCLLAACLVLLNGCSSIKVVETWNKPPVSGHRYTKLMIVGIAHDENLREMAENILVDEMGRSGVTAVASHTLVKEIDNAKREDVVAAVRSVGADAVLTIRAVAKGDTTVTQGGQSGGIYGTAMNDGGVVLQPATTYSLATLQSNLFDVATAEVVWSATIKTYDADRVARVSRDLARFFLENLRKDGFL